MALTNEHHEPKLFEEKSNVAHEEGMAFHGLTEQETALEKKLRLKVDFLIMPLVMLVYLLNYIDRNNYAAARLQGLERDLNLTGSQYEVGLSIFFVSYLIAQVPSNLLLNYSGRPSWYLGFFTCTWGLVSACTSQVKTYPQIVVCRFLLGLVEAPFFSGVMFYLSKWYTRKEISLRMALFYASSMISGAFGNLIAAGILKDLNGARGMAAWQWLYIIEGCMTIFVGLIIILVLPDFPETWRLLTPDMKNVATRRLLIDAAEADIDEAGFMSQIRGMKLAFLDPKTYIFATAYHATTVAAGFQNFFPTLTATLGYSNIVSLLLVAPPYVFVAFWSLGHSWVSDRKMTRFWFYMYPLFVTIVGCIIFMTTSSFGPRYFSFFLMNIVFVLPAISFAWISNSISRPPAKRASALAFTNAFGNAASIWTPFTYYESQGKHYPVAMGVILAGLAVAMICALSLRFYLQKQNKELARFDDANAQLTEKEMGKLRKAAELADVDVATARNILKGYRYMI